MAAESSKKLIFRCECGTVVKAAWKGFPFNKKWVADRCNVCHRKADLSYVEVIQCPHCGEIQKKGNKTCLTCGKSMQVHVENIAISCPGCSTAIYIPNNHKGNYTCEICQYEIDEKLILTEKAKQNIVLADAMLINLKDASEMQAKDLVMYKHPLNEFPFKSQLQVSEGTYALLLQNGICQYPCNPGLHLLEKSNLKSEQRFEAAMTDGDVIFRTDIYGVRKHLPDLSWGGFGRFEGVISGQKASFALRGNGKISFQVTDAKAFADYVGYQEITWSKLTEYNASPNVPDGKLKQLINSLTKEAFNSVCNMLSSENAEISSLSTRKTDISKQLKIELDKLFMPYGLGISTITIADLNAEETDESKAQRTLIELQQQNALRLLNKAQTEINWKLQNIQLNLKDNLRLHAFFDFNGTCRLQIQNREAFFAVPEIREFLAQNATVQENAFFTNKITALLQNHLGSLAQKYIDTDRIENFLDKNAYKVLVDDVQDAVDKELSGMGLSLQNFGLSVTGINQSPALKAHLKIPENKRKIRQYVETLVELKSEPIQIHMRDDVTVYVKAEFTGSVYLRVADEYTFFQASEVQDFIHSDPFVSQQIVKDSYSKRFNGLFTTILSGIVQTVVNDTNANIQEIHLLSSILMQSLSVNLQQRAADLGLSLASLDLKQPKVIEESPNLKKWVEMHQTRSGLGLQQEIDRMKNNHTIFETKENNRVEIAKNEAENELYKHQNTMTGNRLVSDSNLDDLQEDILQKKSDREHQKKVDQLRKQDELNRMVDQMAADKKERDFAEIQKAKHREYSLQEEDIRQKIQQDQMRQQGRIDTEARDKQAEFAKQLNEAENKRVLNDILRKIDESDLDWKKKLDEYARLSRELNVKSDVELNELKAKSKAEIETLESQTAERIKREQDGTYYTIGQTKIKLNAAEAELLERIAQWAEDRQIRTDNAQEERATRKTVLDFEQRMQDRREQVAQEMEKLTLQYQQALAVRDRDDKLAQMEYESKRLQYILDHLTREIVEKAGVEKARFHAEEEIRKAEAQYDKEHRDAKLKADQERLRLQMEQEEKLAQRAEDYKKEMAKLENERNRDDKNAAVAIAQAQASKTIQNIEHSLEKIDNRYHDLCKKMDEIGTEYIKLKERVKGIEKNPIAGKWVQPGVYIPTHPYNPTPAGYNPTPAGYNPTPAGYNPTPAGYNPTPAGYNPTPTGYNPTPAGYNPTPAGYNPTPAGYNPQFGGMSSPATPGTSSGMQPGFGQKTCPKCGHACSTYSTICENCGWSI